MFLILIAGLLAAWLAHLYIKQQRGKVNLPGPPCLPIVGSLRLSKRMYKVFDEWAQKYGQQYYADMLGLRMVVNCDLKVAKDLFSLDAFSGRGSFPLFNLYENENYGIVNSNGNLWEVHRRFTLRQLRDFGFGKNTMEALIMDEVHEFKEMLKKKGGKPIGEIKDKFSLAVVNSLWTVVGGKRYNHNNAKLRSLTNRLADLLTVSSNTGSIIFFMPWLRHIMPDWTGYTAIRTAFENLKEFVVEAVEDHQKTYQADTTRDFIDVYLKEREESQDPQSTFKGSEGVKQLTTVVGDLFFAGTDTTSGTLSWIVLYMATYPEVQKKLQDEILSATGNSRDVSIADRSNMPYANAVIEEILRKRPAAPLGVFRKTLSDVTHKGTTYPKGTFLSINIYHIHHNKKTWGDPENFRPERFLSQDEKTFKKSENVVAFSVGKRQCLGETLARDSLFLFMTNLFQTFKVTCVPNQPQPTLEPGIGFSMNPEEYSVIFNNREE